jgi:hypothetical protein
VYISFVEFVFNLFGFVLVLCVCLVVALIGLDRFCWLGRDSGSASSLFLLRGVSGCSFKRPLTPHLIVCAVVVARFGLRLF